ncbi:MAG: excinuclease ABC subunit C [Chromatiales bacterium 21-64-14]|nr:MAG: excinuclease ABC subunit C [Chromatiales bacterium 21-64-14]HQU15607.1 excinuclease ABC subunit UvrC [Gammaproteobacteria bacterium]
MKEPCISNSFDARGFLRTVSHRPGVYRMVDSSGQALYVGKARDLRKRLGNYFRSGGNSHKTRAMMEQMHHVEVTVTHTEAEALLLECHLIKDLRPRYNILLRDDKSYPYIQVSIEDEYPRMAFHRGAKRARGRYFGPYPSAHSVRESLNLLQKLFQIRPCEDSVFRNRSRPCLQHQIHRCSAPCVGRITPERYRDDVQHAVLFLEGKGDQVIDTLAERMEQAAAQLDYETAARHRDQIASLRRVRERQYVSGEGGDLDIVTAAVRGGAACVQVFFVRAGRNLGNKAFHPRIPAEAEPAEILGAFLSQYYVDREVPTEILVNHPLDDAPLLETALGAQAGHRVTISHRVRGERARWLRMAQTNAECALDAQLASRAGMAGRMQHLREVLELEEAPTRLECFDISHTMGEAATASCVVFNQEGPVKSDYRRFNIQGITPGDDYEALQQAVTRRYTRIQQGEGRLPEVLFIDGGRGQVAQARRVLEELQVAGVTVVGVAKGPARRPGAEVLHRATGGRPILLAPDSPALHLIQQIRDEAHRFAITGHRQRRARARNTSTLETIPGVGPKRRQRLLRQFGGLRELARAGVEDLAGVEGISRELAQRIYDSLHVTDR